MNSEDQAIAEAGPAAAPHQPGDWLGQPRGLIILFLTEMWEVFSFYGMRTMLVYYMTKQLMFAQETASLIYGFYSGSVYLTPIIGGYLADRYLGRRTAVLLGGSIMALGHFLLGFESLFYAALATVAIGNGLFLPSLPAQIGGLYRAGDPRRGSAYNVYYASKNLGAFIAPFVCGTLGELYGWHYGFGAAGVGMLIGVAIYAMGARYMPPDPIRQAAQSVARTEDAGGRLPWGRIGLLIGVGLCVILYRSANEQLGNTVALWLDSGVDRALGDRTIPMTWFQSLNPILVLALTPVLIAFWTASARRGREPSALAKMAIGAGLAALGYLYLLLVVGNAAPAGERSPWMWVMGFYFILTAAELYVVPIGLGLFGRIAPSSRSATVISLWYLTSFFGNVLAGVWGTFWSPLGPQVFFAIPMAIALVACLGLFVASRLGKDIERAA